MEKCVIICCPYESYKNDVMRLGERPRSLEGKPNYFAKKLYYSMFTIAYTPRIPYQFNVTLIECSRIRKDKTVRLAKRLGAAMTARSFHFNIRVSVLS